jgi:hypothetical protein
LRATAKKINSWQHHHSNDKKKKKKKEKISKPAMTGVGQPGWHRGEDGGAVDD